MTDNALMRGRIKARNALIDPYEGSYEQGMAEVQRMMPTKQPGDFYGPGALGDLQNWPAFAASLPVMAMHKWQELPAWFKSQGDKINEGLLEADLNKSAGQETSEAYKKTAGAGFDLASVAPLGNAAFRAAAAQQIPENAAGIFGGRLAKTADLDAMSRAEKMLADGVPRERVWSETGWFKGLDGKMRFEIDDSGARLSNQAWGQAAEPDGATGASAAMIRHPQLYDAYPSLSDGQALVREGAIKGNTDGANVLAQGPDINAARSVALHELQHGVQGQEGFFKGQRTAGEILSNDPVFQANAQKGFPPTYNELPWWQRVFTSPRRYYDQTREANERAWSEWGDRAAAAHQRAPAEIEARTVEARRDLTPEQRRARPPWLDYDVPGEQGVFANSDRAKGLAAGNLDMSQEARMQRAKEMGFDTETVYYHGTPRAGDIAMSGFSADAAAKFGNNGKHPGFFFSKDRADASEYSGVKLIPKRTYERNSLLQKMRVTPPSTRIENTPYDPLATSQAGVIPAYLRLGKTKNIDVSDIEKGVSFQDLQKQAIAEGYDSARLVMDGIPQETIVFDPRNIRSVNARFDPAQSDSANLLAANSDRAKGLAAANLGGFQAPRDSLGYYSQALESAGRWNQGKGTPEQALTWLKKSGVKDAEIEATGVKNYLMGQKQVARDDLVNYLEQNRVGLNEVRYGELSADQKQYGANGMYGREWADLTPEQQTDVAQELGRSHHRTESSAKFSSYSLDPNNPTYRETVLHLPERPIKPSGMAGQSWGDDVTFTDVGSAGDPNFRAGHFPEPNIVGHMMTSMTKHEGKPVFTLDQIQSDWGQRLRDGGVRDEAKIADLVGQGKEVGLTDAAINHLRQQSQRYGEFGGRASDDAVHSNIMDVKAKHGSGFDLWHAELRTAEAATPGNPLVNTTDQWTNTTLRRALRQAVDDGAEYIAIPSGDTVLSYNPGDKAGMNAFYNDIVPKNARKLLEKMDKEAAKPISTSQLQTTQGMKGQGFTLFRITDKVRDAVKGGQPLFANPSRAGGFAIPSTYNALMPEDRRR